MLFSSPRLVDSNASQHNSNNIRKIIRRKAWGLGWKSYGAWSLGRDVESFKFCNWLVQKQRARNSAIQCKILLSLPVVSLVASEFQLKIQTYWGCWFHGSSFKGFFYCFPKVESSQKSNRTWSCEAAEVILDPWNQQGWVSLTAIVKVGSHDPFLDLIIFVTLFQLIETPCINCVQCYWGCAIRC